jgi:hypothetical protein
VVVLTGAGRGFSAGGDVIAMAGDLGGGGDDAAPIDLRSIIEIAELLHTMPAIAARLAAMPPTAEQNLDEIALPLHEYLDVQTERFAECSGSEESIAAAKASLAGR